MLTKGLNWAILISEKGDLVMSDVVSVPVVILAVIALLFVGAVAGAFWLQQRLDARVKEVKELEAQIELKNRTFVSYGRLVDTMLSKNFRFNPPEVGIDMTRFSIRRVTVLPSKAILEIMAFNSLEGESHIGVRVKFPAPGVPDEFSKSRAEAPAEEALIGSGLFKLYTTKDTPSDFDWEVRALEILAAIHRYETEWSAIKDQIPEVNAKLLALHERKQKVEREFRENQQKLELELQEHKKRVEKEIRENQQKFERELRELTKSADGKPQPTT